jgi:pimeloyl-ACP methyl ester carboxylesterase
MKWRITMAERVVNGILLHYETTGQGRPLVFIHGLGSSTRDWEYQVDDFSRSYEVITFDLRGHGQSDKPPGPYSIPMFAEDTAALLKELGVGSAHVVGVSLGGAVALQLALDHPELVKTLTVVNSAPAMHGSPEQIKQEVDRRVAIVQQVGMRAMGEALAPNLFPDPEQTDLRTTFVERWAENDPRAYIDATRSVAEWNVLDKVTSIECPTLVIAAEYDYSPVAVKEAYVKLMPNAQLVVIRGAHHGVPMEKPAEFNSVLAAFLDDRG